MQVACSPCGRQILPGSDDRTVRLGGVATAPFRRPFDGHSGRVESEAFSLTSAPYQVAGRIMGRYGCGTWNTVRSCTASRGTGDPPSTWPFPLRPQRHLRKLRPDPEAPTAAARPPGVAPVGCQVTRDANDTSAIDRRNDAVEAARERYCVGAGLGVASPGRSPMDQRTISSHIRWMSLRSQTS
jgi:hypothetical protein